jgi:hypothetical protein
LDARIRHSVTFLAQIRDVDRSNIMKKLRIIAEYFEFLREQKKWWLFPIVILLFVFGGLVVLTESSPLVAFIYALF